MIGIDIDDLAVRIKGAVVKGHYGRAVRPNGILANCENIIFFLQLGS